MISAYFSPLAHPIDAVIFDCDGTLSSIEGIDELANINHVGHIVKQLTQDAMGISGMTPQLYEKRLTLVRPTQAQVLSAGQEYIKHQTPDILQIIQLLYRLQKVVYIVSAGLLPAVKVLADFLKIPKENVFAVDIQFNQQGEYHDFDRASPMTRKNGKREIVFALKKKHNTLAFVGDGLTDYEVYDQVTRFVGYGGAYYRPNIAALCEYYIKTASMAPLIPFILTEHEMIQLSTVEKIFYQQSLVNNKDIKFA